MFNMVLGKPLIRISWKVFKSFRNLEKGPELENLFRTPFIHHHHCIIVNLINTMLLTAFFQSFQLVHIVSSVWLSLIWKSEQISIPFMIISILVVFRRPVGLSLVHKANRANICGSKRIRYLNQVKIRLKMTLLHGIALARLYRFSLDIILGQLKKMAFLRNFYLKLIIIIIFCFGYSL